ncbi:MAG: hypothetical protein Q7T49_00470 [bacterium]|nr:hypothetical protein [bacterium]
MIKSANATINKSLVSGLAFNSGPLASIDKIAPPETKEKTP